MIILQFTGLSGSGKSTLARSVAEKLIKDKYKNVYTIWINCNITELKKRDTKNLYYRTDLPDGHPDRINNLTGINDPYDIPKEPDLIINTSKYSIEECSMKISTFMTEILKTTINDKKNTNCYNHINK